MTKRGFFIINGIPRVVINQIIRSPGIYYQQKLTQVFKNGKTEFRHLFYADLISQRGAWLRIEMDKYNKIWMCMKKATRIPFFIFLSALGFNKKSIFRLVVLSNLIYRKDNDSDFNMRKISSLSKNWSSILSQKFLNSQSYSLGKLGRSRLNQKLGLNTSLDLFTLTPNDLFACIEGLIDVSQNKRNIDDIDNLKNRRVRTAGELIANQLNKGLLNLEKNLFEKLKKLKKKKFFLKNLIHPSFVNTAFNEFFASSQLSQYLDQTNPLAELTHKRRLSSLGPGGVNRETAGMQIRGIHPTHYARICPIETPEGQNAGLVNSITTFAQFNKNGFIETPYFLVYKGQVQKQTPPIFIGAENENRFHVLLDNITLSSLNFLPKYPLPIRSERKFQILYRKDVNYTLISCFQLISLGTSLIPFLEHNDANRVLMGSNMQRQAVPLLQSNRPVVGTGLENVILYDSNYNLNAKAEGLRTYKSNTVYITNSLISNHIPKFNAFLNISKLNLFFIKFTLIHLYFIPKQKNKFFNIFKKDKLKFQYINTKDNLVKNRILNLVIKYPVNLNRRFFIFKEQNSISLTKTEQSIFYNNLLNYLKILLKFKITFAKKKFNLYKYFRNLKENIVQQKNIFCLTFFQKNRQNKLCNYLLFKNLLNYRRKILPQNTQQKKLKPNIKYFLKTYNRTNQSTCLIQKPFWKHHPWIEKGELLTNTSFSHKGELALGQNILVGYLPWEGYNFEDAVLINERLIYDDMFTSLHIEKYEVQTLETPFGIEQITSKIPQVDNDLLKKLDKRGIIKVGSRVYEGDILVGKITPVKKSMLLPHEKLIYDIVGKEFSLLKDSSLRAPKGAEGQVIQVYISEPSCLSSSMPIKEFQPLKVTVSILEQRKIKIGDKISGRHGNKGIISKILANQYMPYLPDGTALDMVLNPLGVPSRMNVGQLFESLLGFSAKYANKIFKVLPFDESYGYEFSRTLTYFHLYQASKKRKQKWIFSPNYIGKTRLFDGRTGYCLKFPIMVGQSYILKLIHLVDEKIHARSTGTYSLVTQQPLRGRSKHGGQRFGEMEVWAVEGFGAAFILQELLTVKSDDIKGRYLVIDTILSGSSMRFGTPESFKVLVRELQSLCLDIRIQNQKIFIEEKKH